VRSGGGEPENKKNNRGGAKGKAKEGQGNRAEGDRTVFVRDVLSKWGGRGGLKGRGVAEGGGGAGAG